MNHVSFTSFLKHLRLFSNLMILLVIKQLKVVVLFFCYRPAHGIEKGK